MRVVRKGPFEEVALYSGGNGVSEGVGRTWETGGSGCWAEGIAETRASSPERGWGVWGRSRREASVVGVKGAKGKRQEVRLGGVNLTLTSLGAAGREEPSSFYKIFTSLIDFMGFTAPCPVGP